MITCYLFYAFLETITEKYTFSSLSLRNQVEMRITFKNDNVTFHFLYAIRCISYHSIQKN